MNIGIACGGTGGHIFPGLAAAHELRRRGHAVTLWFAGKGVETLAGGAWNGPIITVSAEGFEHGVSLRSVGTAWKLLRAIRLCTRRMKRERPDVLLAMGSYACVGPLGAARRCGVPYVLHESNVIPGRAVRLFARGAAAVAGAFEETGFHLKRKDLALTGMPLRRELARRAATRPPWSAATPFRVLVMGGSGGARRLNEIVPHALASLAASGVAVSVTHLTGRAEEGAVRDRYAALGLAADVLGFTQDMAGLYEQASFAICRSGAATCAELTAFGVPALLVPYPFATNDHQTANARALERIGAADVVADGDLSPAWLCDYLRERIGNPARLSAMSQAGRNRLRAAGADALADLVERVGGANAVPPA